MNTRPFHLRTVAGRGSVVQGQEQRGASRQAPQQQTQQPVGKVFGLASDAEMK